MKWDFHRQELKNLDGQFVNKNGRKQFSWISWIFRSIVVIVTIRRHIWDVD